MIYYVCSLASGEIYFIGDFTECVRYTQKILRRSGMRLSIVTDGYYKDYYNNK